MNKAIITTVLTLAVLTLFVLEVFPYNDERGILKWNPYWFSNFRYSAPTTYYASSRGFPYKRLSETTGSQMYKWSPVYFTGTPWKQQSYHSSDSYNQPSEYYEDPDAVK